MEDGKKETSQKQQPHQASKPGISDEIKLPSGGRARILRKPIGDDAKIAFMMMPASERTMQFCVNMALIAVVAEIDGKRVTYEEVGKMYLEDILVLSDFLLLSPQVSQTSSLPSHRTDSHTTN